MTNSRLEILSRYRLEKAKSEIESAKALVDKRLFNQAVGRAYYSIFHAMRAVLALEGFDSKKHSGIITHFNQNYIKPGIFDKKLGRIVKNAELLRNDSDYKDFFVADETMAMEQIAQAEDFLGEIERYLRGKGV